MPNDGDYIEFGDTGLTSQPDGTYYNKYTKEQITADGKVFSEDGELVYDPDEEEKFK